MTRIVFVSDLHSCEDRIQEQRTTAMLVAEQIIRAKPSAVLIGGDMTGMRVPHRATPAERNALIEFVTTVAEHAPVAVCRGNHDFPGDHRYLDHFRNVCYFEKPAWLNLPDVGQFAVIPWMDRSSFPRDMDWAEAWTRELATFYQGPAAHADFVLGHVAIAGATARVGQPRLTTKEPLLSMGDVLPRSAKAGFFGHYHAHQRLPGKTPAWYGGSLFYNEFGEEGPKGWLCWDSDCPEQVIINKARQPKRVVVEVDARDSTIRCQDPETMGFEPGDHLRVKVVHGGTANLGVAQDALASTIEKAGSVEMQVVRVVAPTVRDGAAEVTEARTDGEKLRAWAKVQLEPPEDRDLSRAAEMLSGLLEGAD